MLCQPLRALLPYSLRGPADSGPGGPSDSLPSPVYRECDCGHTRHPMTCECPLPLTQRLLPSSSSSLLVPELRFSVLIRTEGHWDLGLRLPCPLGLLPRPLTECPVHAPIGRKLAPPKRSRGPATEPGTWRPLSLALRLPPAEGEDPGEIRGSPEDRVCGEGAAVLPRYVCSAEHRRPFGAGQSIPEDVSPSCALYVALGRTHGC